MITLFILGLLPWLRVLELLVQWSYLMKLSGFSFPVVRKERCEK